MHALARIIRKDKFRISIILAALLLCAGSSIATRCHQVARWQAIVSEHFVVKYIAGDQKMALMVLEIAEDAHLDITRDIGYTPEKKTTIFICSSQQEFQKLSGSSSEWILGVALSGGEVILLQAPGNIWGMRVDMNKVVRHEYAHIVLGRILRQGGLDSLPRWLNEGLAMYEAQQWQFTDNLTLGEAYITNHLFPLSQLAASFPHSQKEMELAYAQSFDVVKFIISRYSQEGLKRLIKELFRTSNLDLALKKSLGLDALSLERAWHQDLKKRFNWVCIFADTFWMWLGLPILCLIAYLRKRYQSKKKKEQWDLEDGGYL